MAHILVYIEQVQGRPHPASLTALGEGRRLASALGATLYAALPCVHAPGYGDHDGIAELAQHGADKVVLLEAPQHRGTPMWATCGESLAAACERLAPLLVLCAGTRAGEDLAPRLATRLGAAYVPWAIVRREPHGATLVERPVHGGRFVRIVAADELFEPTVIALAPGAGTAARGDEEAEVLPIPVPPASTDVDDLGPAEEPLAPFADAAIVVSAGAGVGSAAGYRLVERLALALGGQAAATRAACDLGYAPPERALDVDRPIAPRTYVSCAASGSEEHLAAVDPRAAIVALNHDANAPIFRRARHGIVGDLFDVIPALLEALGASTLRP